ncbi:MAG TPA: NAD(P)H-hydrate dehydratase [Croceibacterium sp.]|nr:NAD(P)H-hydrate dehydratase [Croceibacterium sp.]
MVGGAGAADPVLTVAQMRAAEQALIDGGETVESLMERAGIGAADWVWRMAGYRPVSVLCGPGNNGGDGYVIARELRDRGIEVSVIAPLEPATAAARAARASWDGAVGHGGARGVLVDCLFGSELARPLSDELAGLLRREALRHSALVAVDVPSGIDSDRGVALNEDLPRYDLTLALGAWKQAHGLMPALATMGEMRLVPIGIGPVDGAAERLARPRIAPPGPAAHKYSRGLVLVVGGSMPGAALMASEAAMRAGVGAVRLFGAGQQPTALPDLIVREDSLGDLLADKRTGAVLIGPGLGRDGHARERVAEVLAAGLPTVLDADALTLLWPAAIEGGDAPRILTPHEGELARLAESFGVEADGKLATARALASATGSVIVAKGPDTVIAEPGGRTVFAPSPTSWLAIAGTGDVLAGIAASRLAARGDAFMAACEAVWLHGEAARLRSPAFLASKLARGVSRAYTATL